MISERRDYFRIVDEVLIRYQPIDEASAVRNQVPIQFSSDETYSLMNELQAIDHINNKYLLNLVDENHDLLAYLKAMNKKIDIIASHIAGAIKPASDQKKKTITISEGGLSFHSSKDHPHDSFLALQITLLPSHQTLVLFGKVINCSFIDGENSVAISFVNLHDNERQLIAKHIMQQQMAERRKQQLDNSE